jgi:hypothetical protein
MLEVCVLGVISIVSDCFVVSLPEEVFWPFCCSLILTIVVSFSLCVRISKQYASLAILTCLGLVMVQLASLFGNIEQFFQQRVSWYLVQTLLVIGTIEMIGCVLFLPLYDLESVTCKWIYISGLICGSVGVGMLYLGNDKHFIGSVIVSIRIIISTFILIFLAFKIFFR